MIRNRYVLFAFCLVVGGMFIWAGLQKVIDSLEFAQSIRNYRVVGQDISFVVALILPWVEVICGACLIIGLFRRASALLISLMLVGFIILVASAMVRGLDVECGCFGSFSSKADFRLILQDIILLIFSLNIFLAPSLPKRSSQT